LTLTFNQTHTIHWDTNNENITADSVFAANNIVGVSVEKNDGPISITNSKFCNIIGADTQGGLIFRNSENTTVTGSTVYNQAPSELIITGDAGGILVTNWETGQTYNLITQGLTFTNNIVEDVGSGQSLFKDGSLGGTDWTDFGTTLKSDNNTWWDAVNTIPFIVPTPNDATSDTFAQWQSVTGQDLHSTFAAPAVDPSSSCTVTADGPDFWLLSNQQQTAADAAGNSSFTLTLYGLGGMTGTVKLWIDLSSIPGATATFSPSTVSLLSGTPAVSTLTISSPATIAPGNYTLMVLANTGNVTRTAALTITILSSAVRLSISSLNFGNVIVGATSAAQTVTLTNNGSTDLTITSFTLPAGFSQTNTCGTSVPAGVSCTISVTFAPKKVITYSGTLNITDSDPTSPQKVSVSGVPIGAPVVTLTPKFFTFSSTEYLTPSAANTISLQNTGTADLHISSITVTGTNPSDFMQTNDCSGDIAIDATCTITVTFTPQGSGSRSASVSIADDALVTPTTATLTGTETAAITISPKSMTFSSTVVGSTSTAKTVTVTNGGAAAIPMTGFTFSGTNPTEFAQTNTCGSSLAGGANCTVSVTFTPAATGTRTATLSINDGDPSSPQTVTLTGTGTASTVVLSPTSLSFGNEVYLTPSASQTVTLTNSATMKLSIASIAVTGTNPGDFTQTNTCGTSVKSNGTCTITVTFYPAGLSARTASVTITDSAKGSPQNIPLSGTGVAAITVSPATLTFGSANVGTTGAAQTVTITNSSSVAIAMTGFTFSGTTAPDFAQTNTCGSSLAAGASCTANATFTPAAAGTRSATLSIADGDPSSPQTVAVSGTGSTAPAAVLSPTSLTFGSFAYLRSSPEQKVTLTNSGSAALSITSITTIGINATDFTQKNNCGTSVAASASCTIIMTFTPQGAGTRIASLSVEDNATDSPQIVSLTGTGSAAITVSPTSLTFSSTPVNTPSGAQTVTLTNASRAAISIGALTFSGTDATDFTQTNNCGTSLSGEASCTISVTFKPKAKGTRTGTLTIADGDPTSPETVSLSGTGS
jgi:hypothetical protein